MKNLFHEFKRFEGQPIKIFTDDGRVQTGIDLDAFEDCVRIIDSCGRLKLIEFCHIDSVEEPQMRLHRCRCDSKDFGGEFDEEFDEDFEEDEDECECGCNRCMRCKNHRR